jgi:hypothetical protein
MCCDIVFKYISYKDEFTGSFGPAVYFCLASDTQELCIVHIMCLLGNQMETVYLSKESLVNIGSHIFAALVLVRPKA